jgi:hypothetical protein
MTTQTTEESSAVQANAEKPKPRTKARVAPQRAHVAPSKAKAAKKARPGKKSAKRAKAAGTARGGSKAAKILALLKRADGVTLKELMKATGWQPNSVRGFLSGSISKKMGLTVTSTKTEDGERSYALKA